MKQLIPLLVLALCNSALPDKEVGGRITRDTRWSMADGPYYLTSDLVVEKNARLTISPGCRIIVSNVPKIDTMIAQIDNIDMEKVAIKVHGTIICVGKNEMRITFSPDSSSGRQIPAWYGIVMDNANEQFTEVTHTDITGAYCAISFKECSPSVRNSVFEYNHIGIQCSDRANTQITNCIIAFNTAAGLRVLNANPNISNSIIIRNRNCGFWCDGLSKITISYNCIHENGDGNFMECDPELGIVTHKNDNGDSTDVFNNIFSDPVFIGSVADSAARQHDLSIPTERRKIKDFRIAEIIHAEAKQTKKTTRTTPHGRYRPAKYSPCIDAGNPAKSFRDSDGSRNDIGIWGGPDLTEKRPRQ